MKRSKLNKWKTVVTVQALIIGLLITTLTYVYAQSGTTFTISQGIFPGAPSYTIWREGSTYYAKSAYGAIDYSGTNASQVANNALSSADGVFHFKSGIYELDAPLVVDSDDTIEGEGWNTIFRNTGTDEQDDTINNEANAPSENIVLRNFKIEGQKNSKTYNFTFGIMLMNASNSLISNVWVYQARRHGIYLTTTNYNPNGIRQGMPPVAPHYYFESNSIIENCKVEDSGIPPDIGKGIVVARQTSVIIRNNIAVNNQVANIYGTGSINVTVTGNIAKKSKFSAGIMISYLSHRWIISNNIVMSNYAEGIIQNNGTFTDITGNFIRDNGDSGIEIHDSPTVITGNTVQGNHGDGIYINPDVQSLESIVISGNVIKNNWNRGIEVDSDPTYYAQKISITGNLLTNNDLSYGIQIYGGTNEEFTITGNVVTGSGIDGIRIVNGAADVIIASNYVSENTNWGIYVEDGADYVIINGCNTRGNTDGGIKVVTSANNKVNLSWNGTTWIP